ncbi:8645_t:CDS:2 [Paraglomus occultum]|uniref:8645_t:CDS:1 n=1 Tax=Paraglomus occultum TaxID=144539 RepID=A0A9N9A172_9GLOM|nr:8645_t:CDS:2 [Paraglomus occultum]
MPPSAIKSTHQIKSKRAQRQTASNPNYYEPESSEGEIEDYDMIQDDSAYDDGRYDKPDRKKKHRATSSEFHSDINERLYKMNMQLENDKDILYQQYLAQFDKELKEIQDGTNSDFQESLQELIEIRDNTVTKAELYREYLLECVKRMYEAEASQAEEDYSTEKQGLKEKMLAEVEERRRKLKEDKDSYDLLHDVTVETAPRQHSQRKLRGTKAKDEVEPKTKRSKVAGPSVTARLTDREIEDDLLEMTKAYSSSSKKLGYSHKKK